MKIGLASYEFINNNVTFNLSQIEKAMKSVQGKVELLCFGETFLQGFDALNWNYENDKNVAISVTSEVMQCLCEMTLQYKVDLLFGYIEKSNNHIYSSCAIIENGKLIHNYRRISKGWKKYCITDDHYAEGTETSKFLYHGHHINIAICGDMWDFPERFKTDGLLIWPVYVNFSLDEWKDYEKKYGEQALTAAKRTVMINSISSKPKAHGGAFYFVDGNVEQKLPYDEKQIMILEV